MNLVEITHPFRKCERCGCEVNYKEIHLVVDDEELRQQGMTKCFVVRAREWFEVDDDPR